MTKLDVNCDQIILNKSMKTKTLPYEIALFQSVIFTQSFI